MRARNRQKKEEEERYEQVKKDERGETCRQRGGRKREIKRQRDTEGDRQTHSGEKKTDRAIKWRETDRQTEGEVKKDKERQIHREGER